MFIIGLTGGIASGKSTVARMLQELGAVVIDTDVLARDVVEPGLPAYQEILRTFGKDFFLHDGTLDRKKLGRFVFKDENARKTLNAIVHPRVGEAAGAALQKCLPEDVVILAVPLLIEANMQSTVNEIWLCACSEDTQVKRLMERDGFTEEEARLRTAAQMPLEEKKKFAHKIIDTGVTIDETHAQVTRFFKAVKQSSD